MEKNKVKRSYLRIVEFDLKSNAYVRKCDACERPKAPLSHFTYAIQQVTKQLPKIHKNWQQESQDIDHKFCETKEAEGKGPIIHDERGKLMFTKETEDRRSKEKTSESEKDKFVIIPYYVNVKSIPGDLSEVELDVFEGFIIRTKDADAIRAKREEEFGSEGSDVEEFPEVAVVSAPPLSLDEGADITR